MKKTNILLIFAAISLFCGSCASRKEFRTVTIAMDSSCNPQQQLAAYEVINNRITSLWRVRNRTELIDGKFNVTYSGEDTLLARMLTKRGEVYVTEMFSRHDVQEALNDVYERLFWLSENIYHEPLWQTSHFIHHFSVLISAYPHQVARLDSVFNQYQHYFPANSYFAWSATPNNNGFYELFALKSISNPILLNPNTVREGRIQDNFQGFQHLAIFLERSYHAEWARITRDNVGRHLAIVMDGKVLSPPMVNIEITGGASAISGNFTTDDLLLIKSAILGGILECTARIIEIPNTN